MFSLLKWFSPLRILLLLVLFFCVLRPLVFGTYNLFRAWYWWMRP